MDWKRILDISLRVFVAASLGIYGIAKVVQFGDTSSIDTPLNQLSGMQLMWAFFGYTKTLPIIIGVMQVGGGLMLLFQRTKLLGALILTPILINIILFDIFYEVGGVVYYAILYQLAIVMILFLEKERVLAALKCLTENIPLAKFFSREAVIGYAFGILLFLLITANFYRFILSLF